MSKSGNRLREDSADFPKANRDIRSRNQDVALESRNVVSKTFGENAISSEVREILLAKRDANA